MIIAAGPADVRVHFETLTDPRRGKPTYPFLNVVVMTLCAVISGADDFVAISKWSSKNKAWLARYLDVSDGILSHDRFNTILGAINPREFETCLQRKDMVGKTPACMRSVLFLNRSKIWNDGSVCVRSGWRQIFLFATAKNTRRFGITF